MNSIDALTRSLRAEVARLCRRRTMIPAIGVAALYAAVVTWALIAVAEPREGAVSLQALEQAGGGTRAVAMASTFSSVLVLALFTGIAAGDHARGTWRAALLQQPHRLALAAGTFLGRLAIMVGVTTVVFAVGWITAYVLAPTYGVDTGAWMSASSWQIAGEDLGLVLAFLGGWALLGTALGILTRSVPVALAIGVLWAGPVENAIGEDLALGQRWFPGLLLRELVVGIEQHTNAQVIGTLAVYGVLVLAVVGVVLRRRDVTS